MKKILVIDDLPENINAAKNFFANVSNSTVHYATSRKQAEEMINTNSYDGILSDCSFPYEEGETADDYTDNWKMAELMRINGDVMINIAMLSDIPFVMTTSHGTSNYVYYLIDGVEKSQADKFLISFKAYQGDWRKADYEDRKKIASISRLKMFEMLEQGGVNCSKSNPDFWAVAWKRLQEQK